MKRGPNPAAKLEIPAHLRSKDPPDGLQEDIWGTVIPQVGNPTSTPRSGSTGGNPTCTLPYPDKEKTDVLLVGFGARGRTGHCAQKEGDMGSAYKEGG